MPIGMSTAAPVTTLPSRERHPGNPATLPASPRRLRVAVIVNGVIVEERLLAARAPVSVGTSPAATFILPGPETGNAASTRRTLFVPRGDRYSLHLGAGMHARIADGQQIADHRGHTGGTVVLLPAGARGRLAMDGVTLLFQLVKPPPVLPRPALPASVRGSIWSRVDGWFAAVALGSLLLHLALSIYLRQVDWPRRPDIETLPDRWVHPVQALPKLPPESEVPVTATAPATPRAPRPPRAKPPAPSAAETQAAAAARRASIADRVARTGLVAVLGALAKDGQHLPDLLRDGAVDRDQEAALAQVGAVTVASANAQLHGVRSGDGPGRVVAAAQLRGGADISVATIGPAAGERRVVTTVKTEPPVVDGEGADPDVIAREVKSRVSAVRACYERALKNDPTLAGKIILRIAITPAGTVSSVDVDDESLGSPEVAACLRATVARWRFPATGHALEVAFPFVFQSAG